MTPLLRYALPSVWVLLLGVGFGQIWRYEATPGSRATSRAVSPRTDTPPPRSKRSCILMFVHPDCPCTQASIDGLAELTDRYPGRAQIEIIVAGKGGTVNLEAAKKISGAAIKMDPQGDEARRYGAETSGLVVALAPDGRVLFQGGLTSVRGHYGPSAGLDSLESIMEGKTPAKRSAPVYGCALGFDEGSR